MRRISSHLLWTPRGLEAGKVVSVSDEGTVLDVREAPTGAALDSLAGVEFFPGVLVPGFFNAHCHLELSWMRGLIAPGGGLTGFARGMRAARASGTADREGAAARAAFWDSKMWAEGISRVGDICNGATTFSLKRRSPIAYRNFCELFGLGADPSHAIALRDQALAAGLAAGVTPHSTYSLNRETFQTAVDRDTRNNSPRPLPPLSIHFLESEAEIDLFRRRGPLWEWYAEQGLQPDFLDHGSPAERLIAQTPPEREIMLVHNCCATQRDIDIVMSHFTAPVTWVVCPRSNRHIGNPEPPIDLLRKNGLRIAVGTDSLASNDTLSIVAELALIQNVPLAEMIGWVAAEVIAPGRTPGIVNLTGLDPQTLAPTENTRAKRII